MIIVSLMKDGNGGKSHLYYGRSLAKSVPWWSLVSESQNWLGTLLSRMVWWLWHLLMDVIHVMEVGKTSSLPIHSTDSGVSRPFSFRFSIWTGGLESRYGNRYTVSSWQFLLQRYACRKSNRKVMRNLFRPRCISKVRSRWQDRMVATSDLA